MAVFSKTIFLHRISWPSLVYCLCWLREMQYIWLNWDILQMFTGAELLQRCIWTLDHFTLLLFCCMEWSCVNAYKFILIHQCCLLILSAKIKLKQHNLCYKVLVSIQYQVNTEPVLVIQIIFIVYVCCIIKLLTFCCFYDFSFELFC